MPDGKRLVSQARLMELADMARDGVKEGALFELPCAEMLQLLEHIDILGEGLDLEAGDYCRGCGCTMHNACEGGCDWAEEGLCTACAEIQEDGLVSCPSCGGDGDRGAPEPWCARCDGTGKVPAEPST